MKLLLLTAFLSLLSYEIDDHSQSSSCSSEDELSPTKLYQSLLDEDYSKCRLEKLLKKGFDQLPEEKKPIFLEHVLDYVRMKGIKLDAHKIMPEKPDKVIESTVFSHSCSTINLNKKELLYDCIRKNNVDLVELLLLCAVKVSSDHLRESIVLSGPEIVNLLARRISIKRLNKKFPSGDTPLLFAVKSRKSPDIIKALVDNDEVNLEIADSEGKTIYDYAKEDLAIQNIIRQKNGLAPISVIKNKKERVCCSCGL